MKKPKKILIVEDEEVIRRLCRRILAQNGYELVFACDVKEAREKIGDADPYELLIADMKLPDGSGLEVIRHFRETHARARVLIVTGSLTPEDRGGRLSEWGFTKKDFLFKPFKIKDFESAVREHLEKH